MNRRAVIGGLAAAAALRPWHRAVAQGRPLPLVGFLNSNAAADFEPRLAAFHRGLAAGFVEGRNASLVYGWADYDYDRSIAVLLGPGNTRTDHDRALIEQASDALVLRVRFVAIGGDGDLDKGARRTRPRAGGRRSNRQRAVLRFAVCPAGGAGRAGEDPRHLHPARVPRGRRGWLQSAP
jgi:hypothetical protein